MTRPSEIYTGLVALLRGYLSEASVMASLDTVLKRRGLSPADLGAAELANVVADAMIGLRMFCDPSRLGELMMDLAAYCEQASSAAP